MGKSLSKHILKQMEHHITDGRTERPRGYDTARLNMQRTGTVPSPFRMILPSVDLYCSTRRLGDGNHDVCVFKMKEAVIAQFVDGHGYIYTKPWIPVMARPRIRAAEMVRVYQRA